MKKLLSLVLALVLVLALAAPVFADGDAGSITIKGTEDVSVGGREFKAYKILDVVTYTEDSVVYTVPTAMKNFYNNRYNLTGKEGNYDYLVATKIREETDVTDKTAIEAFVKDALAAAKAANVTAAEATGDATANAAVFQNLPLGYYVVEDVTANLGAGYAISALMLDTTNLNPVITIKTSKTTLEKKIDGDNDEDNDSTGKVDANKGNIGDKVPYVLTTSVPDLRGYTNYFFVVSDTLSKGLEFQNDVKITVGEKTLTRVYTKEVEVEGETVTKYYSDAELTVELTEKPVDAFTVTSTKNADGETYVEIIFVNFYKSNIDVNAGTRITITYSAIIDDDAVIGTAGNPNSAQLTYSNNPNQTSNGDKPGPGDVVGVTPEDRTYTYVTGIELTKVDPNKKTLAGAVFEITGTKQNKYVVHYEEFEVADGGDYYKLNDGTYTKTAPTDATKDLYDNPETKYSLTEKTKTETMSTEKVSFTAEVGADGVLRVDGMEAGTYTITEIKAPAGYNLLEKPIELIIDFDAPTNVDQNHECEWSTESDSWTFDSADGIFKISVENKTGTELPSTGGIGTTIFYVVGGILVAAAAILFVTKKRMSASEN